MNFLTLNDIYKSMVEVIDFTCYCRYFKYNHIELLGKHIETGETLNIVSNLLPSAIIDYSNIEYPPVYKEYYDTIKIHAINKKILDFYLTELANFLEYKTEIRVSIARFDGDLLPKILVYTYTNTKLNEKAISFIDNPDQKLAAMNFEWRFLYSSTKSLV